MDNVYNHNHIDNFIKNNDYAGLKSYMITYNLELKNNKIVPRDTIFFKNQKNYYDQRQLIQKILLNSLYGAVGNISSRWFDQRIAQSTTLTGRCIVKHMASKVNEIIAGEYNHVGEAIVYGDTDSAYFSAFTVMNKQEEFINYEWTKENVIDLYDKVAELANESFAEFMMGAFGCSSENGKIIRATRELCALKGLFITKKRYAVLIFDKEGKRKDQNGKPGEIKAMGLDLKRADTPKTVQDFLNEVLVKVLTGFTKEDTLNYISDFRMQFRSWEPWLKGSPKRVNNLTKYGNIQKQSNNADISSNKNKAKKVMIPGHVLASINWNKLKLIYNDYYSMSISDGAKVIVCKLKLNPSGLTSVAYPVDQLTLPTWFRELPFDHDAMEEALIDKKLSNMISVLNWDLKGNKNDSSFSSLFKF
jgi:DNA polymerase elongation subunit (family B)